MTGDEQAPPSSVGTAPTGDPRRRFLQLSGWLDEEWYLAQIDAGLAAGEDVVAHYLAHGTPRGVAPNPDIARLHRIGAGEDALGQRTARGAGRA